MIEFFLDALELKDEKRTGWELRNVEEPESVADHTWGCATLVMMFSGQEDLNTEKCLKMALVHDLGESKVGDLATRAVDLENKVSKEEKDRKERNALEEMTEKLGSSEIMDLWEEYSERETEEARFVKDMDLVELCLQALKYEKEGRYNPEEENENFQKYDNLDEFFATSRPRLHTDLGKQLFHDIKERYEEAKQD